MNTREYQQTILEMMKLQTPSIATAEPYFEALAKSIELEIARDISVWWRCLQIEKYCILSSNYLKIQKKFDEAIRIFYLETNVSPYINIAALQFLKYYSTDPDALLCSISLFELKMIQIKRGEYISDEVKWDYDPYMILEILLKGLPFEIEPYKGNYVTLIGNEIKDNFRVIDLDEVGEDEE